MPACAERCILPEKELKRPLLHLTMERGIMTPLLPGTSDRVADLGL